MDVLILLYILFLLTTVKVAANKFFKHFEVITGNENIFQQILGYYVVRCIILCH